MSSRTDEQLMLDYQQGDFEAFAELYERYSGRVYGFIRKRIPEPARREDVFQSVFLKLHKSRHRYDSNFPFAPWLFTLVRHCVIDAARAESKNISNTELTEDIASPAVQTESVEIPSMSEENRKLLEMRYEREMSFEAISKHLGLSEPAIRKRISRLLQGLRRKA